MNAITDIQSKGLTRALAEQARTLTFADIPGRDPCMGTSVRAGLYRLWHSGCVGRADQDLVRGTQRARRPARARPIFGHVRAVAGRLGGADQWRGVTCARFRRRKFGDARSSVGRDLCRPCWRSRRNAARPEKDVLTAFVAGYELQCRVGRVVAPGHYDVLGFHATATIGSFGAARGMRAFVAVGAGTVCHRSGHRRHAGGWAEVDVWDDVQTFACGESRVSRADGGETGDARISPADWTSSSASKASPARTARISIPSARWKSRRMAGTFGAISSSTMQPVTWFIRRSRRARKLREQFGVTPDRVERIRVQLEESCDRICNIPAPRTGLEAKFSLRLATAMGLAGIDTGRLSTYSEAVAADPRTGPIA